MVRNFLLSLSLLLLSGVVFSQTTIVGTITEPDGNPAISANVVLERGGVFIQGVSTDFDGKYQINGIEPGTYDIRASYVGFNDKVIQGVLISNKENVIDIVLSAPGVDLKVVEIVEYRIPVIEKDNTTQGQVVSAEDIKNIATKSIAGVASTTAGVGSADDGAALSVKGSRTSSTVYYVDGMQVRGTPPTSEIEQMQVITGGIGAEYGDVAGGIISITTKGPSGKFGGVIEGETSELFNEYGYNFLNASLSGPIIKKDDKAILGYRIAGTYTRQKDDRPSGTPIFRAKDDVIANLEENPVTRDKSGGFIPSAQLLNSDDIQELKYRPNEGNEVLNITGKIDARLSDNIDISIGGSFNKEDDQFTPRFGSTRTTDSRVSGKGSWTTYNSQNNPTQHDKSYRGNFRFRHRLGGTTYQAAADEGADATQPLIQNASYTIQVGYENELTDRADPHHGDKFFDYGYIGKFNYEWVPVFNFTPLGPIHSDYRQNFTGYEAGTVNPILTNYNKFLEDTPNDQLFIAKNGDIDNSFADVWNFHSNVGSVYNYFLKRDNKYYDVKFRTSFDIVPSKNVKHSITFGLSYEQRFYRGYDISPRSLWTVARSLANRHLVGVDTSQVVRQDEFGNDIYKVVNSEGAYPQSKFFKSVRDALGVDHGDFFNIDAYTPDQLSLDMFSAQELNDNSNLGLNYYGYDYVGNQLGNDVTFEDFFTDRDENGIRTFPVAAFQPNYVAGYIQDKFKFNDIYFRVGVRVDRYDANTKVLKDPFSLYEVISAKDFYALDGVDPATRPNNVGDDFKVYVNGDSEKSTDVRAYRDGEKWYFADGSAAKGGEVIFGGETVHPRYIPNRINNIKDEKDYDPKNSFKDYEPVINFAPRIAVSFPISDNANFFAHYDVLTQRPGAGQANESALGYYYLEDRASSTFYSNPNLKPQKTVDYEVGFQQKISSSSSVKLSAYYKELRDMIQQRTYLYVADPINNYDTYDNQDFGTVKGFTFAYDLRRTGNIRINASYSLQFANATGSDADSQQGLTSRGNIRNIFPTSYDERHKVNLSVDYRYGNGNSYNGPEMFGKNILQNAGINFLMTTVSGRPYTQKQLPAILSGETTLGTINGVNKPWTFRLDMRVDKDFSFGKNMGVNVYFRVQNLLDTRNVLSVYEATGSPTDDGYLTSANGQSVLNALSSDEERRAYRDAYQWRLLNPFMFSLPRRMYIGAIFNF